MNSDALIAAGQQIVDSNLYMTLATADESGRPWASPVWYAADGYATFYWVSAPGARHSRNLSVRPELAIVIFDSRVPSGTGQAVYMEAGAHRVEAEEAEHGIEVFSRRSQSQGGEAWSVEDVRDPARLRLYVASVTSYFLLDPDAPGDERAAVSLA